MQGHADAGSGQWQTPRLLYPKQFTDDRSQLITVMKITGVFVLNGVVSCYITTCSLSLIWSATADPVQSRSLGHLSRVTVIVETVFKGKEFQSQNINVQVEGLHGKTVLNLQVALI